MQAVIGDDPFDAPQTDGKLGLAELLSDDLRGSLRIQKAITQDLADGLVGAAIIGPGAGLLRLECGQATLLESIEDLIVALTTVAKLLGGGGDTGLHALAFD